MRIFPFIALGLTAIRGVVAVCSCSDIVAQALQCDPDDASCLCSSGNYLTIFNGCARARRGERCSNKDIQDATDAYNNACASLSSTSSAPTSTSEPTSTSSPTSSSTTTSPTTTTTTSLSSSSSTPSTSSSASSSTSMGPTNTAAATAAGSKPALSTGQIGGVVGGAAGLIVFTTLVIVWFTYRKYKKIDKVADVERIEEVEKFMEGGRQMRAASMSQTSDRLYSTQRPLSYALGEYNSNHHEPEEDDSDNSASNSLQGNYFNRFSGNHMDDSAQAFSNNSPSGGYFPPSSYRNSQRAVSVPAGPGGPMLPTASLSYEEYRNQAYDRREERSYLMQSPSSSSASSSAPHRSVSAPMPNQNQGARISRKPIGNSLSDRSSSNYYQY
ncbi:hypothetical protein TWF694_001034 [Orbilia ellipsospora]|uniref:Extracellular membrane protein CFEM domain-containing protein n=1 Tax=Orbilia ellipsospora TaxID=2528407 RepID=A0AAV9XT20_9PEZI